MRKLSFKTEVAKQIANGLISSGWQKSDYPDVFWKNLNDASWLVVTLIHGSKQYRGQPLGELYVPRVFLIHDKVEAAFDEWCANSGGCPMFPRQAGTLWLAPNFYRLGCLEFYNEHFPLVEPFSDFFTLNDKCKNTDKFAQFVMSDHDAYLFKTLGASSATDQEFYRLNPLTNTHLYKRSEEHIDSCVRDINGAAEWLLEKACNYSKLLDLADTANHEINTALLFGPVWPFRIMQLLLSAGRTDSAKLFKEFLEQMKWARLMGIDYKLATQRINGLFQYYSVSTNKDACPSKIDRSQYLGKYAQMIKRATAADSKHNARISFEWAIFAGGLPGLFTELDQSLYRLR